MREKFLIGIDEAGRGPLAGPVSVATLQMRQETGDKRQGGLIRKNFPNLKDSKKLSEKKREEFFEKIKELKKDGEIDFAVSLVSNIVIDKKGINFAIKKGIERCLKKVKANLKDKIILDGGLKAPIVFKDQTTIIKGDEKEPVISLASICAKVTRDRYMKKVSKKFPKYGFEIHKGYGTERHVEVIKKSGICKLHRKSFTKKITGFGS